MEIEGKSYDIGNGFTLVIVTSVEPALASIARDNGKDILWTGRLDVLKAAVRIGELN